MHRQISWTGHWNWCLLYDEVLHHSIAILNLILFEESQQKLVPLESLPLPFCRLLCTTQTLLVAFSSLRWPFRKELELRRTQQQEVV